MYITTRRAPKVVDEAQFKMALGPDTLSLLSESKLQNDKVRKYLQEVVMEDGELVPGVEVVETEALGAHLS